MKSIITIAGTRPELIRLSQIIKKLDKTNIHTLVWTGQNYDDSLSTIFFRDLGIRQPCFYHKGSNVSFAQQMSNTYQLVENAIEERKPDAALILGDTNSALSAIVCERLGVPVYHMEAGNRCFDPKVPEEKNRRVIDHVSTYNLPYVPNSKQNLYNEGISPEKVFECGNPIAEVMMAHDKDVEESTILEYLHIKPKQYYLATFHRAENVDVKERLEQILRGLESLPNPDYPVICSIHPRTKSKIKQFGLYYNERLKFCEPFGFFDFLSLEKNAKGVCTDSGTVQEECCLYDVPVVTMRDTTERPETVECGSNIVSGLHAERISLYMALMEQRKQWQYPVGYTDLFVSDKVLEFMNV